MNISFLGFYYLLSIIYCLLSIMSLSFESIGTLNSTISTHNKVDVLVEAKKDYTNQLKDILVGPMYNGFLTIYNDAKKSCNKKGLNDQRLKKFQSYISKIPKWTDEELNTECDELQPYLNVIGQNTLLP